MKKIIILFFALTFASCRDNFDEWNDTDQRRISFDICTDGFFDDFLSALDEGYQKGIVYPIEDNQIIRLSAYCYDKEGNLVQNSQKLMDGLGTKSITFFHLQKDDEYRFEFFADVVEADQAVDYFETVFQLGTENINKFYLFCFQPKSLHQYNIVRHSTLRAKPGNNTMAVSLKPVTVNGYCVLCNFQDIERVNGYYAFNESFFINSMSGRMRSSRDYSYKIGGEKNIVMPITTGAISDTVLLKIKRVMLDKVDSSYVFIDNPQNKPFVTEIDCQTLKMKSCVYY